MKEAFSRAALRYRAWPYFYYYSRGKLALDPAYPFIVNLLKDSERPLLDLGCGMGLLAVCLREKGHRAPIVGVDLDAEKIALAQQVLAKENARFLAQDARAFPEHHGDVVLLDALHYFPDDEQQKLLQRIAESVAPGGTAAIRTGVAEWNLRYALTRAEEWFVRATGWIPNRGWNFPQREEVMAPFQAAGFQCEVRPMWGLTPFNSYLFLFRKI